MFGFFFSLFVIRFSVDFGDFGRTLHQCRALAVELRYSKFGARNRLDSKLFELKTNSVQRLEAISIISDRQPMYSQQQLPLSNGGAENLP